MLFFPLSLLAQKTVSTGAVFDYANKSVPLEKVLVRNLTNQASTQTNAQGKFTVQAKVGDLLVFSLAGYQTDTLYLANLLTKIVYLPYSVNALNDVNVVGAKVNSSITQKDETAREYKRIADAGDVNRKRNNDRAGGISLSLGYDKYKRQQQKEQELLERERFDAEIARNFNEETISKQVKLTGSDLKDFIDLFKPSVEQVKSEKPFNYTLYIAQTYHQWLKLPASQRKLKPLLKI